MTFRVHNAVLAVTVAVFVLLIAGCAQQAQPGNATNASNVTNASGAPQQPPASLQARQNVSCAMNAWAFNNGTPSRFNPSTMVCKDDCKAFDPGSVCDPSSCTCVSSCASGGLAAAAAGVANISRNNSTFNSSYEICKDDCKTLNPAAVCDPKTCACKLPVPIPRGCAANSLMTKLLGANSFDPRSMLCQDDCKLIDPAMTCNAQCICVKPPPKPTVSCAVNANSVKGGAANPFNAATMICKDDCKDVDPTLACDPKTCTCQKPPPPSCFFNTFATAISGNNSFNPFSGLACADDCAKYGKSLYCDALTCTCKENATVQNDTLNCATNTLFALDTQNGSIYDPAKYRCEDNCKDLLGSSYSCDALTCTCKKTVENVSTSCAMNTRPSTSTLEKAPPGTMCKDDCQAQFGSDYACEPLSCQCIKKDRIPTLSCAMSSSLYAMLGVKAEAIPSNYICEDDCNTTGFYCDPLLCVCKPHVNVTEGMSCSGNSFEVAYGGGNNTYAAGTMCKDDCKSLDPSLKCDPKTCTCEASKEVSCAQNGYLFDSTDGNQTLSQEGMVCKDDCASITPGSVCDPVSCMCKYPNTTLTASCAARSGGSTTSQLPPGVMCKDDCASIGPGYRCNSDCQCEAPTNESVTHGECDYTHGVCTVVPGSGVSECSTDADCFPYSGEHTECVHQSCLLVAGTGPNECSSDAQCSQNATHAECDSSHQACVEVPGPGSDQCKTDADCAQPTHNVCQSGACVSVDGAGTDQCTSDSQCTQIAPATHTVCDFARGACTVANGSGVNQCGTDADCKPPVVNCAAYCSNAGYSQNLGSSYTSADQCKAAAAESAVQCTSTCIYTSFYSTSNQAGTTTCCCKSKFTYSCTNCPAQPGTQPYCPQCPATKP